MFIELMPLLAERTVLITVAQESDTTVRATVIPKRAREGENVALATPLSFVGTPAELDLNLGHTLAEYVETHQRVGSTLAQAKAEMEAAAKAAQEEAKRKADEKRKAKSPTAAAAAAPSAQPAASAGRDPAPGVTSGLFDAVPAEPGSSQQQPPPPQPPPQQQQQQGGLCL
jgi:PRTRC genetic system protein E